MNITGKIDELQAKIKSELASFLNNQSILLDLRDGLASLQATQPEVFARLQGAYNNLYAKQAVLETRAIDWVKNIADLKTAILSNPDIANALSSGTLSPAVFSGQFWTKVTQYTNAAIPLINEGLTISSQLVTQNGDVTLLKRSIEQGVVLVPTTTTLGINQGLIWMYGLLGVGAAYLVATRKKRA